MKFYQYNSQFSMYSHKVVVNNETYYLTESDDIDKFKENYIARLKEKGRPSENVPFHIEGISLTPEEKSRFSYVSNLKGITLTQLNDYVLRNITPDCDSYRLARLEDMNSNLLEALALQYEENQALRNENITIMEAVVMLYEMINGG